MPPNRRRNAHLERPACHAPGSLYRDGISVTVVTERRQARATVIVEVEPAPALRPAGKPERDPGRTERGRPIPRTALPQAPGPTGRRSERDTEPATAAPGRAGRHRGPHHEDHHQAPREDPARLRPERLAHALAHAVAATAKHGRLRLPADRPLGRSPFHGGSTGQRAGPRADGQSRWSGVSTPPRPVTLKSWDVEVQR